VHILLDKSYVSIVIDWIRPPINSFTDLTWGLMIIAKLTSLNKEIDKKLLDSGLI